MLLNDTRLNKYIFKEWLLSGHYARWGYVLKFTFGSSIIFSSLLQHHFLKTYLIFHICMPAFSVPRLFCCGNDFFKTFSSDQRDYCYLHLQCFLPTLFNLYSDPSTLLPTNHFPAFTSFCLDLWITGFNQENPCLQRYGTTYGSLVGSPVGPHLKRMNAFSPTSINRQ